MRQRVITAIIALAIFIPFIIVGGVPLELFVMLIGVITLYELYGMMGVDKYSAEGLIGMFMMLVVLIPTRFFEVLPEVITPLFLYYVGLVCLMLTMLYKPETVNYYTVGGIAISALYVGYGYHYLLETRAMGLVAVLYVLIIIFSNDSFAYLVGTRLGRIKLAPKISPHKTIEGSLGGIVGALICTWIALSLKPFQAALHFTRGQNVLLTVVLCIVGQFGDLIESAIKRYFDVKDSGWILPGHGGLLDRFDNLLIVLPVFHFIISFF